MFVDLAIVRMLFEVNHINDKHINEEFFHVE
jgi:hypothetical protein